MAKQVIYWNYTLWIFIYSMVFLSIGVTCGELLEIIMPKYNENKNKVIIFIEINLQI